MATEDETPTLSIASLLADQPEGSAVGGSSSFTFTVTRKGNTSGVSSVSYGLTTLQADGADFGATDQLSGMVSFAAGETSRVISIPVINDLIAEPDERFTITLANPQNASLESVALSSADGVIRNDDGEVPIPRTISIAASAADRPEGTTDIVTAFTFTVVRAGDLSGQASVTFRVSSSAASEADFVGNEAPNRVFPTGTISFAANESQRSLSILVANDREIEADESFQVSLSDPTGAALGVASATGVIRNDDVAVVVPRVISLRAPVLDQPEGTNILPGVFSFEIVREGDISQAASVNYRLTTQQASVFDFASSTLPSGSVTFAAGEASRSLSLPIQADRLIEPTESFTLVLSDPIGGSLGVANLEARIIDDDAAVMPVFRFAKISNGAYFLTGSQPERNQIAVGFPDFRPEGVGFYAYADPGAGAPVFRFANLNNGGYFYTGSIAERDATITNFAHLRYEGTTFSVANAGTPGALPVYRLANLNNGAYLYTTSAGERDAAQALGFWRFEGVSFHAPAASDDYPASLTTRGRLELEQPLTGRIDEAGDADWLALAMDAGRSISFDVVAAPGSTVRPIASLIGPSGAVVAAGSPGADGSFVTLTHVPAVPGTYHLAVSSASPEAIGGYEVRAAPTASLIDDYPASAATTARVSPGAATPGANTAGDIERAGDQDWMAVSLEAGGQYRFSVASAAGSALRPALELRSSSGETLATNPNSASTSGIELSYTATASGTYYVAVKGASAGSSGAYQVAATHLNPIVDEYPASTLTTGRVLAGQAGQGKIDTSTDVDWLAVTLEAGRQYQFNVAAVSGSALRPAADLIDATGLVLVGNANTTASSGVDLSFTSTAAGTFYLAIRGTPGATTGAYSASLTSSVVVPPTIEFAPLANPIFIEGTALAPGSISVGLVRSGPLTAASTAVVQLLLDQEATTQDVDLAASGFAAGPITLSFAPGQASQTLLIVARGDALEEPSLEAFNLQIQSLTNGTLGTRASLRLQIQDDERGGGAFHPDTSLASAELPGVDGISLWF